MRMSAALFRDVLGYYIVAVCQVEQNLRLSLDNHNVVLLLYLLYN